jgi:hypothetical protein
MRWSVFGLAVLAGACVTTSVPIAVDYGLVDSPERGGFTLTYKNQSGRSICLSPSVWPNGAGWFDHQGADRIFLRVGAQRFPMKENNGGYCPGCATRVTPGEIVSDFVPYERFDLPPALMNQPKQLEFSPPAQGYPCSD